MTDQEQLAITRSELVESLAEQFPQLLPRDVELAVKTLLDTMTQALAEGKVSSCVALGALFFITVLRVLVATPSRARRY